MTKKKTSRSKEQKKNPEKQTHTCIGKWSLTKEQKVINGKGWSLQHTDDRITVHPHAEKKKHTKDLDNGLMLFIKIKTHGDHRLNVQHKTIKLLEGNMCDLGFGSEFIDTSPKAQSMKEKSVTWISLKRKIFALLKTLLRE